MDRRNQVLVYSLPLISSFSTSYFVRSISLTSPRRIFGNYLLFVLILVIFISFLVSKIVVPHSEDLCLVHFYDFFFKFSVKNYVQIRPLIFFKDLRFYFSFSLRQSLCDSTSGDGSGRSEYNGPVLCHGFSVPTHPPVSPLRKYSDVLEGELVYRHVSHSFWWTVSLQDQKEQKWY